MAFFRRWVDGRHEAVKRAAALAKVNEFVNKRDSLLASLSPGAARTLRKSGQVCRDIESASAENPMMTSDPATDPRLRKLDELMWTYLRLLSIEESLERFLETNGGRICPR